MILKSGPMEVQMIRRREKFVFHVSEERDWQIKFTKVVEQPIPRGHCYQNGEMVMPDAGYDNAELDVSETICKQKQFPYAHCKNSLQGNNSTVS